MNDKERLARDTAKFWDERYSSGQTGWDLGRASLPLEAFLKKLTDTSKRLLIPGAGNAWEAELALSLGFMHCYVVDISSEAIARFKQRVPAFPENQVICADFFSLRGMQFDVILEQTFFCALHPDLRTSYVTKMHELLAPSGILVGVLFASAMNDDKPPFGGNIETYQAFFNPYFTTSFKPCINSVAPRLGNELWMECVKK
jgi:SAM-dependent methyltransferase